MNEEMIAKLKEAKSAEDVAAIAKEYGKELALEQARAILDRVKAACAGELSDDALGAVAGGAASDFHPLAGGAASDLHPLIDPRLMGRPSAAPEQTTVEDAADPHNW